MSKNLVLFYIKISKHLHYNVLYNCAKWHVSPEVGLQWFSDYCFFLVFFIIVLHLRLWQYSTYFFRSWSHISCEAVQAKHPHLNKNRVTKSQFKKATSKKTKFIFGRRSRFLHDLWTKQNSIECNTRPYHLKYVGMGCLDWYRAKKPLDAGHVLTFCNKMANNRNFCIFLVLFLEGLRSQPSKIIKKNTKN